MIGSNYGDCGKGLITDYLCRRYLPSLNVRFNGGAQAGHTVVDTERKGAPRRHVFRHFGAGAFAGATTFWSRFAIVNPMEFMVEHAKMVALGEAWPLVLDPMAPVTTPFDMLVNHAAEADRGGARHGSCGMGIGETVERTERYDGLYAKDLYNTARVRSFLLSVEQEWVPLRASELGLRRTPRLSQSFIDHYLRDCDAMTRYVGEPRAFADVAHAFQDVVFEGAQGLALDACADGFPHVTRSRTGMTNVRLLAGEADLSVQPVYVTRWYLTRHGAGPLPEEMPTPDYVVDRTNVPNEHQGVMRVAPMVLDVWAARVNADRNVGDRPPIVAITCLDQMPSGSGSREQLYDVTCEAFGAAVEATSVLASTGPSSDDVNHMVFEDVAHA